MAKYKDVITRHEKELNRLHLELKTKAKLRNNCTSSKEAWHRAASDFHNFRTSVNDWLERIENEKVCDWADAREFIFQYFAVDPVYFRSGYAKEMLIKKIKPCDINKQEAQTLRQLIIKRIKTKALRDFRKFCQLIPRIRTKEFHSEIEALSQVTDRYVAKRANFALKYFE